MDNPMKFRYYVKDVYGKPMRYPADKESEMIFHRLRPWVKTVSDDQTADMQFFGVETEEVISPITQIV